MSERVDVASTLEALREACRRPLFLDVALVDSELKNTADGNINQNPNAESTTNCFQTRSKYNDEVEESPLTNSLLAKHPPQKRPRLRSHAPLREKPSYHILSEAAKLLPMMTESEHGEVSHLMAILLLGFFFTHSTGNDFFLLQNIPVTEHMMTSEERAKNKIAGYGLSMPLEERLQNTTRHFRPFDGGEYDTISDEKLAYAMQLFIMQGVKPFLACRPAHETNVDFLHLLAMAIHPQPDAKRHIKETYARFMEEGNNNNYSWQLALRLMNGLAAHTFHIRYARRLQFIKLMVDNLVLPAYDPENSPLLSSPLHHGALPHLRASLHEFAQGAMSPYDAHWAHCAVVNIVIQSANLSVVKEEWDLLLNRIVMDRSKHHPYNKCCLRCITKNRSLRKHRSLFIPLSKENFCPHSARGWLLAEFVTRYCESRRVVDAEFLELATSSITDVIEWQLHCWTKPVSTSKNGPKEVQDPPCLLASLLFAAKTLFYYLSTMDEDEDAGAAGDLLIQSAIRVLSHWDKSIVNQASDLLVLAFSYRSKEAMTECAPKVIENVASCIQSLLKTPGEDFDSVGLEGVVAVSSRLSPNFAYTLIHYLLKRIDGLEKEDAGYEIHMTLLCRLISTITSSNPSIGLKEAKSITNLLDKEPVERAKLQIIAALLSCRQARFFRLEEDPIRESMEKSLLTPLSMKSSSSQVQLARYAMVTGNFTVANMLHQRLQRQLTSWQYQLWLQTLGKVSEGELILAKNAAKGIPAATVALRSALSHLLSLKSRCKMPNCNFHFQQRFLSLRVDFLDLLTSLRHFIREIRLSGSGPSKKTRSYLHMHNTIKCFDGLAGRYFALYREFGLFVCQQSQSCLRSLHALCRFVAQSTRVAFSDVLHFTGKKLEALQEKLGPAGDTSFPSTRLVHQLGQSILDKMSPSIDLVVRAATMLELIDGLMLVPVPFPKGFFSPKSTPSATLHVSALPEESSHDVGEDLADRHRDDLKSIECYPGLCFGFLVNGNIPDACLLNCTLPFSRLIIWYRVLFDEPLPQEEENGGEEKAEGEDEEDMKTDGKEGPQEEQPAFKGVKTSLFPSGNFFVPVECDPIRAEGEYRLEIKLGCCDVRGGEWEIPMENGVATIGVRISRHG